MGTEEDRNLAIDVVSIPFKDIWFTDKEDEFVVGDGMVYFRLKVIGSETPPSISPIEWAMGGYDHPYGWS